MLRAAGFFVARALTMLGYAPVPTPSFSSGTYLTKSSGGRTLVAHTKELTMWKDRRAAELDDDLLLCPECGDTYMHQGNVTVYERCEDADWTTVIAQDGENVVATKFPSSDTHNPSYRRHGLTIEFWCEHCNSHEHGKPFYLAIQQHKGQTFLEWVA